MFRQHHGDWLTFRAQAERTPPRLTITFTLDALPQSWARSKQHRPRTWTAVFGLILLLPFTALIAAALLNRLGWHVAMQWIGSSTTAILAASVSLFIGIPVAFVISLWRIVRIGLRSEPGTLEGLLALEFAPLHLAVALTALVIGGLFVGHLAADSYACMNGVRSAC